MSKLVSVYSSKSTSTAFAFFSLLSESTFWIMAVSMLRTFHLPKGLLMLAVLLARTSEDDASDPSRLCDRPAFRDTFSAVMGSGTVTFFGTSTVTPPSASISARTM